MSYDLIVHAACYNEERMLPFFLDYYSKIAKKIVVYDNYSTDKSVDIVKSYSNTKIIPFDTSEKVSDFKLTKLKNNCWKGDDSEYSIICDIDEFIYSNNFSKLLENTLDFDAYIPIGFQMVSDFFPDCNVQIFEQIKSGYRDDVFGKMALIRPKKLLATNYNHGAHSANPIASTRLLGRANVFKAADSKLDLKLLHYKNLGFEYLYQRISMAKARLGDDTLKHGLGIHYTYSEEKWKKEYEEMLLKSTQVI